MAVKDGNFEPVRLELATLVKANTLGATLFEPAFCSILSSKVAEVIHVEVDGLLHSSTPADLTKAALQAAKEAADTRLRELDGLDMLPLKRRIDIRYGCYTLNDVEVKSVAEEVDLRFAGAIKRLAVTQQTLSKTSFEELCCTHETQTCNHNRTIPDSMVTKSEAMRVRLNSLIKDAAAATADTMMQVVVEKVACHVSSCCLQASMQH